jgi:DNA helicase-2/ATP-dependent DNA helicase PcrA
MKRRIQAGVAPEEIAILYRVHTDARAVVEHLLKSKMDFQMKERLPNLYQHFIAKDVCAYFRLAMGKGTRQDLLGVMNRPKRYLSRDALSSKEVNFEAMRTFYVDKDWMMDRVDQLEWDLKMLAKMAPYAALQYLKKRVGYEEFLREYAKERKVPIADLQEIYAQLEESARPHTTMEAWFSHMQEYQDALREKERSRGQKNEGIRLMTMHAAKGLEFDTVYIIEANEGQIPYKKALKEHGLEEERRLFYVGMTRAKEVLRIVYVKTKNGKDVTPSRFVEELLAAKN